MRVLILSIFLQFPLFGDEILPSLFHFENLGNSYLGILGSNYSKYPGLRLGYEKKLENFQFFFSGIYLKENKLQKSTNIFGDSVTLKQSISTSNLLSGFRFHFLDFFINHNQDYSKTFGGGLGIHITQNKSIYLQYNYNKEDFYKYYSLSIVGKGDLSIGMEFTKITSPDVKENSMYFSLNISLDSLIGGVSYKDYFERVNSTYYYTVNYRFTKNSNDFLYREENPYIEEGPLNKKIPIHPKKLRLKLPYSKEKKVHQLSLQELLNKKIPLSLALKISQASKNPDSFKKLLPTLPKQIKVKVIGLQIEKAKREKKK